MIWFARQYADDSICRELEQWCYQNPDKFKSGKTLSDKECECFKQDENRRITVGGISDYPEAAYRISRDLSTRFPFIGEPMEHFGNGIVAGIIYPPGDFYPHTDADYKVDGKSVIGFNLLVSQPEGGGDVTVSGKTHSLRRGDMMAYPITDYEHSVAAITGSQPRVMWYWRFYCDLAAWEALSARNAK